MPPAITTNTFYQLLGKVFTTLAAVLTISIIARSLGPESLGTFTKATVFASLFYMLADFGFNAIFLKNNPDNERFKENYGNLMGVRIIAAIGLFLIATLVVLVLPFDPVNPGVGNPPLNEMVPALLEKFAEGYDMVVGARQSGSHAGNHRAVANDLFSRLATWMVQQPVMPARMLLIFAVKAIHRDRRTGKAASKRKNN